MPSPDYMERSLCFSLAPTLKLSKTQVLELMPGVFTKTEPIETTSIKAGRPTHQIQAGILEKEKEKNECLVPEVREKRKTAQPVTFAIQRYYRNLQSKFTLIF